MAWFSPDCTHFSKAKGGKPRNKKIRGLAWVVVKWAAQVRPRVIIMENVEEFQTWGPLDDQGHPVKSRSGEFFRAFVGALSTGSGPLADELRAELDEAREENQLLRTRVARQQNGRRRGELVHVPRSTALVMWEPRAAGRR